MLGLWYHFPCSCHFFSSQNWGASENSLAKTVDSGFTISESLIWESFTAQKYYAWIHMTETIESWKILEYQSLGLKLQFVISWKKDPNTLFDWKFWSSSTNYFTLKTAAPLNYTDETAHLFRILLNAEPRAEL